MKKDVVVALIAVVLVVVASYVLASVRPDRPLTPSRPFVAPSAAAEKKIASDDKVVMHVNGEPVTEREFNMLAMQAPAETRAFYQTVEGRRLLADEMVKLKALEQEGHRLGIDQDPEVRTQVGSIASQIVAGKALEKLVGEEADKRVAAEFAKEKATSKTLRHILVAYEGSAVPPKSGQPQSVEAAMQKARAIVGRIRGGASFEQMAQAESDDVQTAGRGGMLGAARPEQLPPNIASVVNTLAPGQVSDPLRTEFGIHIFRVDQPSLEDMRPMLVERLKREVAAETLDRLHKSAKVELDASYFPPAPRLPEPPRSPKTSG